MARETVEHVFAKADMERILAITLVNGTAASQLLATFSQPVNLVTVQQHLHADCRLHQLEIHPVLFHQFPPSRNDLPEVYISCEFSTRAATILLLQLLSWSLVGLPHR